MSRESGLSVGTDGTFEVWFKDENDDPVLRKHLPLSATLGDGRKSDLLLLGGFCENTTEQHGEYDSLLV
jgi:hypothetical protein